MITSFSFSANNAFLSNFWPSYIQLEGMHFKTVEHAYQAMKTVDQTERHAVANCDTP